MEGLYLFLYVVFFFVLYAVSERFLQKIRNLPPSPFPSLPLIGHLYLFKKPLYRTLSKISDKYGPVLLFNFGSRPVLVISAPSVADECLAKNDVVFANRPHFVSGEHFGYNYTSLAWSSYGDHWRNLRRISSIEILSTHRLQLLSGIRADEARLLVRQIYKTSMNEKSDRIVDLKNAFFELTTNVMMMMISGKRYFGEGMGDDARKYHTIVTETFQLGSVSNLIDFMPIMRWFNHGGLEKQMKELHKKRDEFMQNLIENHKREMVDDSKKKKTLIQVLLDLQLTDPEYYTDQMIRSLMLVLLIAGTDTSSGTMEWAMSLLLNNPEALNKARIKIEAQVGHGRLLEESDLANLPYLNCIINETLRMYPPGPLSIPHESSNECTIGGYRVPRGTTLFVNLWAIHNDPKIWKNPSEFKPERFEGLEGNRDGFKYMPFGSGRRGCPGEGLASRMVGLALGLMIQCFEWERIGDEMVDMTEGTGLLLHKAQPLMAKCSPRSSMVKLLSQI